MSTAHHPREDSYSPQVFQLLFGSFEHLSEVVYFHVARDMRPRCLIMNNLSQPAASTRASN